MSATTLQFFWRDRAINGKFRAGVSLHSHTMYSQETLASIPEYLKRIPFLNKAAGASDLDLKNAYWTPPLAPRQAHRLEEKQINRQLQLPALISLTDHDDATAGTLLRVLDRFRHAPISTEWTIPFGNTFFHLGVHNMPAGSANSLMEELNRFTADPREDRLQGLLDELNASSETLLVLNHPLWDEKGIGSINHAHTLGRLLERHGRSIHALELNGLRSWKENEQVIGLARDMEIPAVAGGDRHGLEPNSLLNLSRAETLPEFIRDTRFKRISHVIVMPQYRAPLAVRISQMVADILREYPDRVARRHWTDRMFLRVPGQADPTPFSAIWENGAPTLLKAAVGAVHVLDWRSIRWALRLMARREEALISDRELAA